MSEVLITEAAEEEYSASLLWYAQRSKKAARSFEAEFAKALLSVEANPERYPFCADNRHRYCQLKRYPFQLVFRSTNAGRLVVVAVAHASRKPNYWKKR